MVKLYMDLKLTEGKPSPWAGEDEGRGKVSSAGKSQVLSDAGTAESASNLIC